MVPKLIDWLTALDLRRAYSNCHADLYGDWYRDPWSWPELRWLVYKRPDLIAARLNSEHVAAVALLDVAKENFATRPAVVIEPIDRLIYQALVDYGSVKLVGDVQPWVFVGRLHRKDPKRGIYPRRNEWDNYRERLMLLVSRYKAVLKTDIVSCFSSVPMDQLVAHARAKIGDGKVTDRLELMLRRWDEHPHRSGLLRFVASSVLATSYLAPVDDVLYRYSSNIGGAKRWIPPRAVRWMDDIWLFGAKPERLRRAQLDLQDAMRSIGLNMNASKTDVLEGGEAEREVQQREHSAVDSGLSGAPADDQPLIDRLLSKPTKASRTSLKFVSARLRKNGLFGRVDEFASAAHEMPHGADALARLFRDSGRWRDLQDWYVDYARSDWGRIEWSVAQFGTMFPSAEMSPPVAELFVELLPANTSLSLTAVAAQRMSVWDPPRARALIRERLAKADHPLQRRVLALAALEAGEDSGFVQAVLSEFEDNVPTLEFLKATSFRKVRSSRDFSGS